MFAQFSQLASQFNLESLSLDNLQKDPETKSESGDDKNLDNKIEVKSISSLFESRNLTDDSDTLTHLKHDNESLKLTIRNFIEENKQINLALDKSNCETAAAMELFQQERQKNDDLKSAIEDNEKVSSKMREKQQKLTAKIRSYEEEISKMRLLVESKAIEKNIDLDDSNTCEICSRLKMENESLRSSNIILLQQANDDKVDNNSLSDLTDKFDQLQTDHMSIQNDYTTLLEQYNITKQKVNSSESTIDQLQIEVNSKQKQIEEMKQKNDNFTDMMKEKVKGFIENSKKWEELKTKMNADVHEKESECTSLRLKLSAIEVSYNESKTSRNDLSDRVGELSRENGRLSETINSHVITIDLLTQQINANEAESKKLQVEISNLKQCVENEQKLHVSLVEQNEHIVAERVQAINQEHDKIVSELQNIIQQHMATIYDLKEANKKIHSDICQMEERLKGEDNATRVLDDYKTRAQKALKQANTTASTLNTRISELQQEIENVKQINSLLENNAEKNRDEIMNLIATEKSLNDQIEKQQIEVQTLQTECIQLRSDNDTKQLKNRELTALVDKLKDDMKRREHSTPTKVLTGVTHGHERHEGELTSSEYPYPYPSLSPSHGHAHQKQSHHAVEYVHDDISDSMIPSPLNIQPRDTDGTLDNTSSTLDNTSSTSTSSYEHMDHYNQASGMGNGTMSPVPTSNVADVYTDGDDAGRLVDKSGDTRMGGDMMIVRELQNEIIHLRLEMKSLRNEYDTVRQSLSHSDEEKKKIKNKLDELTSFHERTKKLLNSNESAINIEYLKRCVYQLMVTRDISERSRLYPVISTILKFTEQEVYLIQKTVNEEISSTPLAIVDSAWSNISDLASSSLSGIFGLSASTSTQESSSSSQALTYRNTSG